jgi:hypothetical protein
LVHLKVAPQALNAAFLVVLMATLLVSVKLLVLHMVRLLLSIYLVIAILGVVIKHD